MSYMHIGQHGSADPNIVEFTTPSTEEEYKDLKKELEGIGYNLVVRRKFTEQHFLTRKRKMNEFREEIAK
jgi:ribosome-interacting GTPase 1